MDPDVVVLALAAGWTFFYYRRSRGRPWNPLWTAFSFTLVALVTIVAGLSGYTLSRHERFVTGTSWSGSIIWAEVLAGLAAAVVAAACWRMALTRLRHHPGANSGVET